MEQTASERQFDILRLYGELVADREDWSGALVLACGERADIVPAGVSIANGTTLWVTEDAASAKATLRRGEVDFVVNTLDEALRTLKNQVRQGRPLGVALTGDVAVGLSELAERGVLPEKMFGHADLAGSLYSHAIAALQSSGMLLRYGPMRGRDAERWSRSMTILHRKRYYAYRVHAESLSELREIDVQLLERLAEQDLARRRWLQRVSRYLRDTPNGGRWVWLTEEEFQALPESWNVSPESPQ